MSEQKTKPTPVIVETEGITKNPRLLIIEEPKITNESGDLIFDSYKFLQEAWSEGSVILATPNVPLSDLEPVKKAFSRDADGDNLDLTAAIYSSIDGGSSSKETDRWEIGWDDGTRVFVRVYPKEFFDSQPNAREIFDQKIVPSLLRE